MLLFCAWQHVRAFLNALAGAPVRAHEDSFLEGTNVAFMRAGNATAQLKLATPFLTSSSTTRTVLRMRNLECSNSYLLGEYPLPAPEGM